MPDAYQDGVFFHKSTRILAMPDVRESLIAFYKLLKETFPLEGMVMHISAFLAVPVGTPFHPRRRHPLPRAVHSVFP